MNDKQRFADKRILITGATGVLGSALACRLAQADADLVLLARRKDNLEALDDKIAELGGRAPMLVEMDFLRAPDIQYQELAGALAQDLAQDGLDSLILAAGLHTGLQPVENLPLKDWTRILDVNLNAPFKLIQQLLPLLKQAHGHLIGISTPAEQQAKAFWGAYGVSKAALDTLLSICEQETEGTMLVSRFVPAPLPSPIRGQVYPGETRDSLPPVEDSVDQLLNLLAPTQQ